MSDLSDFCARADSDELGEFLRAIVFPGEGFGCYETFDVRPGATRMDPDRLVGWWRQRGFGDDSEWGTTAAECAEMGQGWTLHFDDLTIDVAWFWDGDGYLTFGVFGGDCQRFVVNSDCKKDYRWEEDEGWKR